MPIPEWLFELALSSSLVFGIAIGVLFVVAAGLFAVRQWKLLKAEGRDSIHQRILEELEHLSLEMELLRARLPEEMERRSLAPESEPAEEGERE